MKYRYLAVAASLLLLSLFLAFPSANGAGQQTSDLARIRILPAPATANDNISIRIFGEWPNGCVPQEPKVSLADNQIQIATSNPGQVCGQAITSWDHTLAIGKLPVGFYQVTVIHSSSSSDQSVIGTRSFSVSPPGVGLQFYPLPRPVRLLDTRPGHSGCFTPGAPLGNDAIRAQQATGACTGIPADAQAVVGNATVVNSPTVSTGFNWITLYPSDAPQPNVSNLNFTDNQIVPNWFTVRLGSDGAFKIYSRAATHLVVDITGYYAPPRIGGLYYHPLPAPVRVFDSRPGFFACDAPGAPLSAGGTRTVMAQGFCFGATIPHNAKAIAGNATVVNSISSGNHFVTLYPFGEQQPNTSNLNFSDNQIVPNWFTVGLSPDGKFNIHSDAATHFVVDVTGYYSEDPLDVNGSGLLFKPLMTPVRLFDSRPGQSACQAPGAPLFDNGTISLPATGICLTETIPTTARAIEGNATVVNFISTGFHWITLYPCDVQPPNTSNLNFTANQIVPNWFITKLSNEKTTCIYSRAATHFITDVTGYFAL